MVMAKAKMRKTKVKKAKRAVTARKTKTKKGKRPVKKAVRKTKSVKSKAKKPVAKKAAPSKPKTYKILMMGAAYGSLLAAKMLFGGHQIHHVCLPAEADLINAEGFKVRLPVRGRSDPVVLDSQKLPGKVTASGTAGVNPKDFDLIGLAMQEPQYRSPGVRELLDAVAKSKVPCMSIMNMPPLPYLARVPGVVKRVSSNPDSYVYLAESIRVHPDQAALAAMMERAGLERVEYFNLAAGIAAVHRGYKAV